MLKIAGEEAHCLLCDWFIAKHAQTNVDNQRPNSGIQWGAAKIEKNTRQWGKGNLFSRGKIGKKSLGKKKREITELEIHLE